MRTVLLTNIIILISVLHLSSQNGLERIIVEKYYISDDNDASQNSVGGVLPVGSVTYRVYVDMLPGYNFQSCYGTTIPEHELKIATSTRFFNNEDRGSVFPAYSKNTAKNNTVMLDTWISSGFGCAGHLGIMKSSDNGIDNVINSDGILKSTNPEAGIPLSQQDGLIAGTTNQIITAGIAEGPNGTSALFDNSNDMPLGSMFKTLDGLWGVPGGSMGPNLQENIVLIGQFTTDGTFSFELNIQIGKDGSLVEQYVAKSVEGNERTIPSLIYPLTVQTDDLINDNNRIFEIKPNILASSITLDEAILKDEVSKYEIFDSSGAILLSGRVNSSNNTIYLENIPLGNYFVRLYIGDIKMVARFIKI
jgi:hypothetical protein